VRVAFIGKGGAGKSTVASTFARLLARRGRDVVAVDSDPMPGLCFGLGLPVVERPIPDEAVVEKAEGEEGPRYRLRPGLDATTALRDYSLIGADGVRLLAFGKTRGEWGDIAKGQHAWSQILNELPYDGFDLVGDLPGGTRQPMTGWGKYADTMIIVVEPTAKSINTACRLATLQNSRWDYHQIVAVVNRASEPSDGLVVAERTGLPVIGVLPIDDEVASADRLGVAALDASPQCAFVAAVDKLVDTCLTRFDQVPAKEFVK
jgi:CO dehydrogenase maturation factor